MCSPVEHYFCFYLIFFLYDFDVPRKNSFRRCPQKNDKLCPKNIGLSSSYLSPVKTIIDVLGKVVYLNTLEPEILYLAYLKLEVTSSAIVGLNAFWLVLTFPKKD